MTERDKFINYVKNMLDKPFVSLQSGADAGFASKLADRQCLSETSIEELSITLEPRWAKFPAAHPIGLLVSKKQ